MNKPKTDSVIASIEAGRAKRCEIMKDNHIHPLLLLLIFAAALLIMCKIEQF